MLVLSHRRLMFVNYSIGAITIILFLLDLSSLQDVRELIEVNHWHGCWLYSYFQTYVFVDFAIYVIQISMFVTSWFLLKSTYWKSTRFILAASILILALYMAVGWKCEP